MKKFLALALALAMIFSLCACGETATTATEAPKAEEAEPAAEEAAAKTEYKVGVAIYQFDDNFMTLYRNELESYMKSLETDDMKFDITIVDGKNDMAEQTNQINNFITQGMDAIILNLVQTSSADSVIDSIVAAGIPCILINREPLGDNGDESYKGILDNAGVCYVGADARQSGTFQGEIVAELPNHGDINGDGKISYIMIEGDPENVDAQYRTEFSVKALTDAGYEVECLDDQVGNWAQAKGQEITANDLAKFGEAVEVVFCNNDAMALGAAAAIEAAGRTVGQDIYLLGVDALAECVEMVNNGTMTGTVLNDHIGQSHAAVDAAIAALKGEALQNYYWVDYVKVAAEATEAAPAAAEPAATEIKVGIAAPDVTHGWVAGVAYYAEKYCKDNILTYKTVTSSDAAEMQAGLQDLVAWGANVIVSYPQWAGMETAIEEVIQAGIPVVNFDVDVDCEGVYMVTGDNYDMGYQSAKYITGIVGEAANIVVMDVPSSGSICELRKQGFYDYLKEINYDTSNIFEIQEAAFSNADGLKDMADVLEAHPQIDAVYSMDDETSLGAIQAITEAGRTDIKAITGGGGCQNYFKVIASDEGKAVGAASALYSPMMICNAIENAITLMNGGTVDQKMIIPTTIVSAENVEQYLDAENTIY